MPGLDDADANVRSGPLYMTPCSRVHLDARRFDCPRLTEGCKIGWSALLVTGGAWSQVTHMRSVRCPQRHGEWGLQ